ncbi:hypothetical protein Javan406_0006 [Streptococcus phage Javan406]|nr:hypothetical protein Javan406_0006 [Streptococcus phage Javan406]
MLLSLKENQFNIVTSILASTALFSELKTGHKFFNKLEIFHFFIDFEDHDK